jgi:hypothetical protein
MAKSKEIFTLIRSLSKQEKRFFKLYCGKTADKEGDASEWNFIQLFDDLNHFKGDDEDAFVTQHAERPYIDDLSYYKTRLQSKIVEACLNMTNRTVDHQLGKTLAEARFLRNRRMMPSCIKKLNKAHKLALEFEKHEILLEILRLKRSHYMESKDDHQADVVLVNKELVAIAKIVANKCVYLEIKDILFLEQKKKARERKQERLAELKALMEQPIMKMPTGDEEEGPICFDAKNSFYFAHALYHQLNGDWATALSFHTLIFNLWKDAPHIQKDRPVQFRNALNNYLELCCSCDRYDNFEEALAYMENPDYHSEDDRIEAIQNSLYIRLTDAIGKCQWPTVADVIKKYNENQEAIENKIHTSRIMAFYLHFAWCDLINQRYPEAVKWLDRILDLGKPNVRNDIRNLAYLLKPIIRMEQGEAYESVFDSELRSGHRRLNNSGDLLEYEKAVVQFLNKFHDFIDRNVEIEAARCLKDYLHELSKTEKGQNALGIEILTQWLESRIRQIDLRAIVEEQWLRRPI